MSLLLKALQKQNTGRPPVWLMRQAGRYLPEYRELRSKYSLRDLFFTPELAAEVTKMPLSRFGVDAAILFSDITVVAVALGFSLEFQEGPKIFPAANPLIPLGFSPEKLEPVIQTIRLLKKDLNIPLLGFCGGPFTVASYMVGDMDKTLSWMRGDPKSFGHFLDQITRVTCVYLQMQEEAGVDAVQVFDSWANVLSKEEFETYSLAPLKQLISSVKIPSLFFMRESKAFIEKIPCALSLDWTVSLKEARGKTAQVLQGNLNPDFLFLPLDQIREKTIEILELMRNDPGFIVNLGHGVKVGTPVDAVECFVDTVKNRPLA